MTVRNVTDWQDVDLRPRRTYWHQVDGSDATDIAAAVQNHSGAGITSRVQGPLVIVGNVGAGGHYSKVTDLALLTFCTAAGNVCKIFVPAPNANIFLGPQLTQVDPSMIADVINACLGTLSDISGLPAVSYSGGVRLNSGRDDL